MAGMLVYLTNCSSGGQTSAAADIIAGADAACGYQRFCSQNATFTSGPITAAKAAPLPEYSQKEMIENPQEFAVEAVRAIKTRLADQLVEGIQYQKLNEWYEMSQLDTEIESWQAHMEPAQKAFYDQVVFDSKVERLFVQDLESMAEVKLYVKLPGWFTVPTPIGEYNPTGPSSGSRTTSTASLRANRCST